MTLAAERPVRSLAGPSRFNPLYHTGPISVLLLVIVFATGIYLTMFYRFGFEASYQAVAAVEGNLVGRIIRAAHRYASIALVVTAMLHGWRTFVMDRFRGPRRLSWASGVVSVAIVWTIGITGYWLIWDERAAALNEVLRRMLSLFPRGLDFLLDNLLTSAAGTGWVFLLLVFAAHLLLSVAVGGLVVFHATRVARPQWMPSRFWVAIVSGSVALLAIAWPLGMLQPVDVTVAPGRIPLDPFYLFLLPAGMSWSPIPFWVTVSGVLLLVAAVPWLLRRRASPSIVVDAERCTGCTLCVIDCPYSALAMADREQEGRLHVAVVDPSRCVGCGICVGSCPVEALSFPGHPAALLAEDLSTAAAAGSLVIACERHAALGDMAPDTVVVPCVGMLHPDLLGEVAAAEGPVHVVGCPPGDCANRSGNEYLDARLDRRRQPRLRRTYAGALITASWVTPGQVAGTAEDDGFANHDRQGRWPQRVPVVALVLLVAVVTVAATTLAVSVGGDSAALTIAIDHRPGTPIAGFEEAPGTEGSAQRLVVTVDEAIVLDVTIGLVAADQPQTALYAGRVTLDPGTHRVTVELGDEDGDRAVLFDDTVALAEHAALALEYGDVELVDPVAAGRELFEAQTLARGAGCQICHSLQEGRVLVGPSLFGIADRAGTSVLGLSAEEYLRQSIVDPDAHVVEGFPPGQMLPDYEERLTGDDIEHLIAFLMTQESP